jgi:hypothetical protein
LHTKKAQCFLYNVLQQELKNDARSMEWRLKKVSRGRPLLERQGRSDQSTGLGEMIYKHGCLGGVDKTSGLGRKAKKEQGSAH